MSRLCKTGLKQTKSEIMAPVNSKLKKGSLKKERPKDKKMKLMGIKRAKTKKGMVKKRAKEKNATSKKPTILWL